MSMLPKQILKRIALLGLSAFFIAAGVAHFVIPDFFVSIVPPGLPAQLQLVHLSGIFEIVGGLAVLAPRTRELAGRGLILLLLAVYPANIHMALHPEAFPELQPAALYARLPLQFVFIAWAYWATRSEQSDTPFGGLP